MMKHSLLDHYHNYLSAKVQQFKRNLDLEIQNNKTPLGKRQTKCRVQGGPSSRPKLHVKVSLTGYFVELASRVLSSL